MKFAKMGLMAAMMLVGTLAAVPANAATFLFGFSGGSLGNHASAVGTFDIADSAVQAINAGSPSFGFPANLTMTITGAGAGSGTFTAQNFVTMLFQTPSALDFSKDLVGQRLADGSVFGVNGGDFNFFGLTPHAPLGVNRFTLAANNGFGPRMTLTSLIAITPVPEPATWAMMILGLGVVGFAMRRTRQAGRLAQA